MVEIALLWKDTSHIARNRFDDNGGNFVSMRLHDLLNGIKVVIRYGNRVCRRTFRDAGT